MVTVVDGGNSASSLYNPRYDDGDYMTKGGREGGERASQGVKISR